MVSDLSMNFLAYFSRFGFGSGKQYGSSNASYHESTSFYIPDSRISFAHSGGAFWLVSLITGITFILLAVMLIIYPELLAFFFAGVMMFVGLFFISTAIFLRSAKSRISQDII
jgi:hypothetical protein